MLCFVVHFNEWLGNVFACLIISREFHLGHKSVLLLAHLKVWALRQWPGFLVFGQRFFEQASSKL